MSNLTLSPTVDVRRAVDRYQSQLGWLDSKHSFSFGQHFDHANTHHGLLLVNNDDIVDAGTGFETHPHRDMEIVTWVLEGALVHQDSTGHSGIIYPGLAQRMSAGSGILHSEKNDSWRLHDDRGPAGRLVRPHQREAPQQGRPREAGRAHWVSDRHAASLPRPCRGPDRDDYRRVGNGRWRPKSGVASSTARHAIGAGRLFEEQR